MNYNPFTLEGKTILVTGASSGIGRQIAIECSRLNAEIILTARNSIRLNETLQEMHGSVHSIIQADLLDTEQLLKLIDEVPVLDGVVLCSGKGLTLPMQFSKHEDFLDIYQTNLFAPFELLRQLYKKKKIKKGGSVVTIVSIGGLNIFSGSNGIYGSSKAALASAMKFCAKEFASRKVRVNSIAPGMVDTPLIHRGTVSEEQLKENEKMYPLGRYGVPTDIAYGAVYLLSDASAWVTGHTLVIDGGISIK